jgi:transcriptional regulator with XRE-family HTH domain
MSKMTQQIPVEYKSRLDFISTMLREIRFSEGKNQNDYAESGISRKQIQRSEMGCNLTLVSLFKILDAYDYSLSEFFEGME